MIKDETDILYHRIKTAVGFERSKKFKKWFHEQYPGEEMHHCFGSYSQSIKTSDYCSIPLTRRLHESAEKHKSEFAIDHLPLMISIMVKYIKYLESKK